MSALDIPALTAPLSADAPAGQDVEFDPAYFELERLGRGTPDSVMGDEVKAGQEPDFREVKKAALALFDKTRDLRVAMILVAASLKEDGLIGFRDGVGLIRGFIESLWEHFHPKLDPEDNLDPTLRVNILKGFDGDGSEADLYKFKKRLREAVLTNSKRRIGKFTYRDIQVARGEIPPPPPREGQPAVVADMALINAAFEDTPSEDLLATQAALQGGLDELSALDSALAVKIGPGSGPDLTGIKEVLSQLKGVIDERLARRGMGEAPAAMEEGVMASAPGGGGSPRGGVALSGEISSRTDVIRVLDKICEYYARFEPTSPVPIFMERAKRLVTMNFVDVIKDLVPEAISKIEVYTGQRMEGQDGSN